MRWRLDAWHLFAQRNETPFPSNYRGGQWSIGLTAGIDIRALGRAERAKHEFSRQPLGVLFSGH